MTTKRDKINEKLRFGIIMLPLKLKTSPPGLCRDFFFLLLQKQMNQFTDFHNKPNHTFVFCLFCMLTSVINIRWGHQKPH